MKNLIKSPTVFWIAIALLNIVIGGGLGALRFLSTQLGKVEVPAFVLLSQQNVKLSQHIEGRLSTVEVRINQMEQRVGALEELRITQPSEGK